MYSTYTDSMVLQHRASLASNARQARMAREARSGTQVRPTRGVRESRPRRAIRFPRLVLHRIAAAH